MSALTYSYQAKPARAAKTPASPTYRPTARQARSSQRPSPSKPSSTASTPRFLARSAPARKPDLTKQAPVVRETLKQPGQPLPTATRREMESKLRHDLSEVRIHTGPVAAKSAAALRAEAYTLGQHIVFAPGRYSPGSPDGQRLLAHELTHVVQQSQPGAHAGTPRLEAQADQTAARVHSQTVHPLQVSPAPLAIQRKVLKPTDDIMPVGGDYLTVPTGGEGDWTYVFYDDHFKVIKAITEPDPAHQGKRRSTGQIGPSWVCNNPGNLTFNPHQDESKAGAYAKAMNRHCLENKAFAEPLLWGPRPFAIFPTYATGRGAMIGWIKKILDPAPSDPDLQQVPADKRPNSISSALATYAPASDGGNKPDKYTTAVTDSINTRRKAAGLAAVDPKAAVSVSNTDTGPQVLNDADMQAWSEGSATAEGGHSINSWEMWIWESYIDKSLYEKVTKFGGTFPKPAAKWCSTNRISLTPAPVEK